MKHSHLPRSPLRISVARWPGKRFDTGIQHGRFSCGCPYIDIELLGYDLNICWVGWNAKRHA